MPIYAYQCQNGHTFDRYLTVAKYDTPQTCSCGAAGQRVISVPMLIIRSPDICYDSPIDGRPITSMAARQEDLARSNCVPYDPDIKQDYQRRIEREEARVEANVDDTVERTIAAMPARKREKLAAEMEGGMGVETVRETPSVKPVTVPISH